MSDYPAMTPNAVYEVIQDAINRHLFNQHQQGSVSGVNYHWGAEDALSALLTKLKNKYGVGA